MQRIAIAVSLSLLAAAPAMAGTFQKSDVAAGAKWAAFVDVEALFKSQLGQFIMAKAADKDAGLNDKIQQFVKTVGFDPTKDLKSVTLYALDGAGKSGVAIIRCKYNKDTLLGLLSKNAGHETSEYGTITIHQWTEEKGDTTKTNYGCFYDDSTVMVASSADTLKSAIDVMQGKKDSLPADAMPAMAKAPAGTFAMITALEIAVPDQAPNAAVMKKIASLSATMGEADGKLAIKVAAVAKTAKDAADIGKVIDGFLTMAALAGAQDDDQTTPKAQAIALLNQIKIDVTDTALTAAVAWDVEAIEALLEKVVSMQKAVTAVKVAPATN